MYSEIQQGSCLDIQGLKCHIPPEGYVYNNLTKQLEYIGVYSRSDNPKEQYWERFQLPSWYKEVTKKEDDYLKRKKEDDPPFYDERYEEFKRIEWNKRLNGFWFMNNGTPTYLVGLHYMFLNWWQIDIGFPRFRIIDLEYFYFLQYCIEDPECMGMIEVCKRRNGKTFRAGLFITEYITRTKMTNGSIQSKTGGDAKKVFAKAIINPFRKLPRFFRPEYDMSLGINPKTEIRFQQTNIRGKKAEENLDKEELGSMIDWSSADAGALDGMKVHRNFNDEFAKTIECNIHDRHEVIRYCLLDEEGRIIGKTLYSSTVEILETDREGVQEGAKLLWDESDQLNRSENGRTISGLYRFFTSAKRSKNFDIYGFPDEEKTLKEILADRDSVKSNPRALSARMRKEPLTIQEAFSQDADKCVFNTIKMDGREDFLKENPIPKRTVIFYRDGETQKVKWRDARKGEYFYWRMSPDCDLDTPTQNKFIIENGSKKPANARFGAITVDSYSNSQGGRKYGSKASAWLGIKKDGIRKPVGWLYGRPDVKEELHNQVMLCSEFFGYQAWYEHTSDDYLSYFRERGKVHYLGIYPMSMIDHTKRNKENLERHRGTPITPFSLTKQLDKGIYYFEEHIDWIDFEEVFPLARKFDPYNRTESDAIVSLLMLITILDEPFYSPPPKRTPLIQTFPAKSSSLN